MKAFFGLILFFVFLGSNCFGQMDKRYLTPNVVYCFHGDLASPYQFPGSQSNNSYLELKDSTLIPFNEHHTFEDVLDLDKLGFELDTGHYRILFIDEVFGVMRQETIYFSANREENYFQIYFEFLVCWLQAPYHYLHFKNGTNNLMNDYCRNIDTIINSAADESFYLEINGIISDSVTIEIANMRVDAVYDRLSSAGIAANRLIKNYTPTPDTTLGFERFMVHYPPDKMGNKDGFEYCAGIQVKEIKIPPKSE